MKLKAIYKIIIQGLFIVLLFTQLGALSQTLEIQKSIYFENAKHDLVKESKIVLDNITDSLKGLQSYHIFIKGNTDNTGDSVFNKKLSQQRVLATQQYLVEKGVKPEVFSTAAAGEEKPIGDNTTEEGKQKNRRVDISVFSAKSKPSENVNLLPSIWELYKKTERKPQEFCVNLKRDTVLRCEKGTIIYVKANSFKIPATCKSKCVSIKIKEDFLKSDMIMDNLSTTSNGKIIETQGMIYSEADDCNGNKLNLIKGKDLVVMLPTDKIIPNAKLFQGNRTPHDSIMNWTVSNNSVLSNFSLAELNVCHDWICGGGQRCPFFFCKIRSFFQKLFGRKSNTRIGVQPSAKMIPKCEELDKLYKNYKVNNLGDLVNAVNKPLLDSFRVKTVVELEDTLRKMNLKKVELSYLSKTLNYEDFKYYVYNTSRLGWSNIDVFANIDPNQMVKMKINLKVATNIDCKIVFKDRRFVIPPSKAENKYEFGKIPKGEAAWIIAIKYEGGTPYLFMEETTIENKTIDVDFKLLTLEELKEKLKVLDQ